MWQTKKHIYSIMVMYATALHLTWASVLTFADSALGATAVEALYRYIYPAPVLTIALTSAALMAICAMFTRVPWIVFLLLPQQALLCMSAAGAIEAMWLGQFADGVQRDFGFIAVDQMHIVLAAVGHTLAIIAHACRLR